MAAIEHDHEHTPGESTSEHHASQSPRSMSTLAWIAVVTSILASMFLFALDNTIIANIQPVIIAALGDTEKLPWISVGFALGAIAFNLLISHIFTRFNTKWLFISGVVLFNVGSAICGAAPTMNALIVGRIICGLGGVGIYVGGMNLLSVLTTEAERPTYLGICGLSWGFGTVLGPILGGALAGARSGWRWCFYLNLFVGVVAAPVFLFLVPSHNPRPGASIVAQLKEIDWLGAILNAGAVLTLVMGISFGGSVYPWDSGQTIALFVCAGVFWLAFILQQTFAVLTTKEDRLFPVEYLKNREMCIIFAQIASAATIVYIPLFFIPLFFQFARNDSTIQAGVRLLPIVFFQVFGTVLSGAIMNLVGYYVLFYLIGGILSLAGGILFYLVDFDTPASAIYGYSVLVGLGGGLFVQAGFPVAQLKVPASKIPSVVQFVGYGQITGITLALAVANTIFLNEATDKISSVLPGIPREIVQQGVTGTGGKFLESLELSQRGPVLAAIVVSIRNLYAMVIAAGALSTLLALFMKRERINDASKSSAVALGNGEVEKQTDP